MDNSINFRFADLSEASVIMKFIHNHIKNNHVMSVNQELFLYEFQDNKKLNIAVAEKFGEILGLFGILKYNSTLYPDITGSFWLNSCSHKYPMLGLKLRDFALKNFKHRTFSGIGAGLDTKNIYSFLKLKWIELDQYFFINPKLSNFSIIKISKINNHLNIKKNDCDEVSSEFLNKNELRKVINSKLLPYKDENYIIKKFVNNKFRNYRFLVKRKNNNLVALLIFRIERFCESSALRIIDFYGELEYLNDFLEHCKVIVCNENHEYYDMYCYNIPQKILNSTSLEKNNKNEEVIIPNYFNPFLKKNISIYGVYDDHSNLEPRFFKGDTDQDRLN